MNSTHICAKRNKLKISARSACYLMPFWVSQSSVPQTNLKSNLDRIIPQSCHLAPAYAFHKNIKFHENSSSLCKIRDLTHDFTLQWDVGFQKTGTWNNWITTESLMLEGPLDIFQSCSSGMLRSKFHWVLDVSMDGHPAPCLSSPLQSWMVAKK